MRPLLHISLLTAIALALSLRLSAQESFILRHFAEDKGLAGNYVTGAVEFPDGRLLVATKGGVNLFDGRQFTGLVCDSESVDNVSALAATADGVVLGLADGDLIHCDMVDSKRIVTGVEEQIVAVFGRERSSLIAVSRLNKLITLKDGKVSVSPLSEDEMLVNTVALLSEKRLLVGTNEGLSVAENITNGAVKTIPLAGIPSSRVMSIAIDTIHSTVWVGTEDAGIYTIPIGEDGHLGEARKFILSDGESIDEVRSIHCDRRGRLWLGIGNGGMMRLSFNRNGDLATATVTTMTDPVLRQHQIHSMYEDSENTLWVCTFGGGLVQVIDKVFDNPFDQDWLREQRITRLFRDKEGRVWLGIDKGLFHTSMERRGAQFTYHHIGGQNVTSIVQGRDGALWVGTAANGIYHRPNGSDRFKNVTLPDGNLANAINALTLSGDNVHVCTKNGLYVLDNQVRVTRHITTINGLPHNNVLYTLTDRNGNVWIANQGNRIALLRDNEIHFLEEGNSQSITDVQHILEDRKGRLWFATSGSGVFILDSGTAHNVHEQDGLPSSYCYEMVEDDDGNIWVSHQKAISQINPQLRVSRVIGHESLSPVANTMITSMFKDVNGNIWVTSTHGVVKYDPKIDKAGRTLPKLTIAGMRVGDRILSPEQRMRLPYGKYAVNFHLSGVSLRHPDRIRYKYRLLGYSDEWSEEFASDIIQFPRLEDGEYVLEVMARKTSGDWMPEPERFTFSIAKPIYRTWPFYVVTTVLVIAIVGGYIRYRTVKLTADKLELEKLVSDRTMEIQRQKVEIENSRDEISRYAKDITDSIKYAQRIQSAIFPEWNNKSAILPDSFVFFRSKDIVSGDFFFAEKVGDLAIFAAVDCTGHGVPGGFMSIVANNLLTQAVRQVGLTRPSDILDFMNEGITNTLHQTYEESSVKDGLDIALCTLDIRSRHLQFAGAYNPLYIFRDGQLLVYRGDRFPVGMFVGEEIRTFTNIEIALRPGDVIYIFSDGYSDQFGGPRGKKLKLIGFREILEEAQNMPMNRQEKFLAQRLDEWMGNIEQVDDIVVMGVRIS